MSGGQFNHNEILEVTGPRSIWEGHTLGTMKGRRREINRGRIHSLQEQFDPPANSGTMIVRTIGMLGARVDIEGYSQAQFATYVKTVTQELAKWHLGHLYGTSKPGINWWRPSIPDILREDRAQLEECVRREMRKGISGNVIYAIGNEPNLFPNITPEEYAQLYTGYRQIIKGINPRARVAMGNLFPTELVAPEDVDVLGNLLITHGKNEYHKGLDQFIASQNDWAIATVFLGTFGLAAPIYFLAEAYGEYAVRLAVRDIRDMIKERLLKYPTMRDYFKAVLNALPDNTPPDFVAYHIYAYDQAAQWGQWSLSNKVYYSVRGNMIPFYEKYGYSPWHIITEYGNIVPGLNESQVLDRTIDMLSVFNDSFRNYWTWTGSPSWVSNPVYGALFYKPVGVDGQFSKIGVEPPFSRLVNFPTFDIAPYLNNGTTIPCAQLNDIANYFHWQIRQSHCESP